MRSIPPLQSTLCANYAPTPTVYVAPVERSAISATTPSIGRAGLKTVDEVVRNTLDTYAIEYGHAGDWNRGKHPVQVKNTFPELYKIPGRT